MNNHPTPNTAASLNQRSGAARHPLVGQGPQGQANVTIIERLG